MADVVARAASFFAVDLADLLVCRWARPRELVEGSSMSTIYELEDGSKERRVSW